MAKKPQLQGTVTASSGLPPLPDLGPVPIGSVRFESAIGIVQVPLGDGSPVQTQGFGGWEEIERKRNKSITAWRGRQPWSITIPVMFDRWAEEDDGRSVEPELGMLEKLAGSGLDGEPPVCKVRSGGLIPHDYRHNPKTRWVINGLEFGESIRNSDGRRVRAAVTVTILEYVHPKLVKQRSAAKRSAEREKARRARDRGEAEHAHAVALSRAKRIKAKPGDTLQKIAKRYLGDADRWREIGKLNKIRDPRSIKAGQVIRLP